MGTFQKWLYGLGAALIGGVANGFVSFFSSMGIDPAHFNFTSGLNNSLKLAAANALMAGLLSAFLYLKQSPLPVDQQNAAGK